MNGQETFRDGEDDSHIEIELPEKPQAEKEDQFV